ncbi:c-type cytochrome, partial [Endothiovibrio diazotrophicus]
PKQEVILSRALKALILSCVLATAPIAAKAADTSPVTDYRQQTMKAAEGHLRAAKVLVVEGLRIPGHPEHHAEALKKFGRLLPELFPTGSGGGESEAKPTVWSDAQGFREVVGEFTDATEAFARAAAGSSEAKEAYYRVQEACRSCHKRFRER